MSRFDVIQHRALLCQMLLKQLQSWLTPGEAGSGHFWGTVAIFWILQLLRKEERLRVLLASLQLLGEVSETMRPHYLKLLRSAKTCFQSFELQTSQRLNNGLQEARADSRKSPYERVISSDRGVVLTLT